MKCKYPVVLSKDKVVGCGQCFNCRVNKRRIWTHRILLESTYYDSNVFLTLTYDDDNVPDDGSLDPTHLTLFLKRLRKNYEGKIRYFAVGEYGDKTERPHYHMALFNYGNCHFGQTRPRKQCCEQCDFIRRLWNKGNIYMGSVTVDSAEYIGGYTVKKMNSIEDQRLKGRYPEFARMSRKPGIGFNIVDDVSEVLLRYGVETVPFDLRHGKKLLPLGQYLREKISEKTGLPKAKFKDKDDTLQKLWAKIEEDGKSCKADSKYHKLSVALWKLHRFRTEALERRAESAKRKRTL